MRDSDVNDAKCRRAAVGQTDRQCNVPNDIRTLERRAKFLPIAPSFFFDCRGGILKVASEPDDIKMMPF